MNRTQAEQSGYVFTGAYSHDKEEMKERAKQERAKGNKAIVVNEPPDKYSRGYRGMGYSVYFIESEANKAARLKAEKIAKIRRIETRLKAAKAEVDKIQAEYDKALAAIDFEWRWNKD